MPRRSGGNASASKVRVSGVTIAAPMPWDARAAISSAVEGASAAAAEDAVKSAIPVMNMRLRPKRSPSAAPVSRSTAYASTYALTVHSSDWIEAPRSRWMLGKATLTTRLSRTTMNKPIETIASVHPLRIEPVMPKYLLISEC